MKLNHTICILLLALLAGVPAWAQDVVCSADPYGLYSVDTEENNGEGSTHAVYAWTVIPVGAVITPDQGPNGSSNVVSVDWSAVAPGTYTLEVVETDTITGCVGEIIELEVQLEDPLQPVIVCTPVATDQVDFNWNAVAGATGYEIEVFVNGVSVNSFGNYPLTSIEVTGLSPNDEVTIEVTPLGSGQTCFEMGTETCNSVACLPNFIEEEVATICDSELPYSWNGNTYNSSGSFIVTLQSVEGCDSIALLNLTVNPVQTGSEDVIICDNQLPYNWNGTAYNAGGSYEVTLQTAAGCDSIATLNLTVNPAVTGSEDVTICDSQLPYNWNGNAYNAGGSYNVTLQTAAGCDSIATLNLTVNPIETGSEDVTICDSQLPYNWNGNVYNAAGSYDVTLQTAAGCDSIATLNLTVNPAVTGSEDVTICDSQFPYNWNGNAYNAGGSFEVTLQTAAGCDSIATLNLTVNPAVTGSEDVTICDSQLPYNWNGNVYNAAGSYDVTLQTAAGCDSIATLNLTVNPAVTGSEDATICDSQLPYNWNGNVYNAAGSYDVTLQTAAGCDSIATLNLTVNPAVTGSEDVTICDSQLPYNWNGNLYNAAGSYDVTLQTAAGCDSIATLNLTVNPAVTGSEDVTICDSQLPYNWNGNAYNAAGSYDVILQTAAGCDSIATLNLTVNPAVTGSEDVTICDSQFPYAWNGNTYNAAGSYDLTLQTAAGCDSIATLNLTVNPAVTGSEDVTICDSQLPYNWNGNAYSAAGSYDVTLQTAAGCDSIATLNLTVNISGSAPEIQCWEIATLNDLSCEWVIEGIQPEVPTLVNCWDVFSFDPDSCDWVNNGVQPEEPTAVNCWDDYQFVESSCSWVNQGNAGDAPVAGITPSALLIDCDNSSVTLVASGNGSYEWQDSNGNAIGSATTVTITQGGTYTLVVTAANGCFDQEQVTINQDSNTPSVSIDASSLELNCETTSITLTAAATVSGGSFGWSNGAGNTNTISVSAADDYEVTFTADNGCVATDVITIGEDAGAPQIQITSTNNDFTCDVTQIILTASGGDTYEWSTGETGSSITVSAAGPYSVTGSTANGCDDAANIVLGSDLTAPVASIGSTTLELTCEIDEIMLTASGGGTYDWNNGLSSSASLAVTIAGDYTVVVEAANGCTDEAMVTVTQNADVPVAEITASANEITCDVPSIILTGSGGVSYSWNGGLGNEATLEVSEQGLYSLVVTASNGCQATAEIQIIEDIIPSPIGINNLTGTNELTCTTTAIEVQATGATSYSWSDGLGFSDLASISQPGIYTVTGTGDNGCIATAQIDITSDGNLPVVEIINNTGTNTLTCVVTEIAVTVNSNIVGDVTWGNGLGTNPDQIFGTPGTYTVSVLDPATGCVGTASVTIGEDIQLPIPQIFNATGEDVITCDVESIDLFATGGDAYEWRDEFDNVVSAVADLTINTSGVYTVNVTGSNGCSDVASYTISESLDLPVVDVTATIDELTCTNPSAILTAAGGGTYAWSNGLGAAASVSITIGGNYSVVVTGDNGCEQTGSIFIAENLDVPGANITADIDEITCADTQAILTATGNGSVEWGSGLGSNSSISVSTPGVYTAIITGSNGCVSNTQFEITQDITPVNAQVTPAAAQLTCEIEEITLTASGGVDYSWSNGLTGSTIAVSVPDVYTVTVTGANGCADEALVNVTRSADLPVISVVASDDTLSCAVLSSVLTASGVSTYSWTDASGNNIGVGASLVVTSPGVYTVSGLAANGCTGAESFEVFGDFALPAVTVDNITGTDQLTCIVQQITLEVSGGVSYQWSNGLGSGAVVNVSTPANYSVTVIGLNGCQNTLQYEITEDADAPVVVIDNVTGTNELTCAVQSIEVVASGGFIYSWNNGLGFGDDQTLNTEGDYQVTVTGLNGCTSTATVSITQDLSSPAISIVNPSASNLLTCTNTSIALTAAGGESYEWFDGLGNSIGTDAILNATQPGVYTVIGIGGNGCDGSAIFEVLQDVVSPSIELTNLTGATELTCLVETIDVDVEYAEGSLAWNTAFGSSNSIAITEPGLYEVTLTALNGCTNVASIIITEDVSTPGAAINNLTGVTQLDCATTVIELSGSGNGSISWSGGNVTGNTASVTVDDTYILTVTGINGCVSTDQIQITLDEAAPIAAIAASPNLTVIDCINQEIVLTASGGVSFEWTDAFGNAVSNVADLIVDEQGDYTVVVTAANGCTATEFIFISENIQLPVVAITNVPSESELTCTLAQITLNASGADTYEWTDLSGNVVGTGDQLIVDSPGTFTATGSLANGCVSDNQVVITQDIAAPGASVSNITGASILTCSLNEIVLQAVGNGSYSWSDGSVVLSTTADLTVGAPGDYTVTVTGANGCTSEATVEIDSDGNIPVVSINNVTNEDVLTCDVIQIDLQALGTGTFEWTNAGGSVVSATADLTVTQPGDYEVTLTAINGCSASTAVSITEDVALPIVNIVNTTGTDELTCDVTSIDLTATGAVSYVWNGGETSASITVSADGTYTVTATGDNGCENEFSVIITEDVLVPSVAITNITNTTVLTCDVTSIDVVASGADDYEWTNEAGAVIGNSAALTINSPGEFTVEGTLANGCTSTALIIITEDEVAPLAAITNLDNTTTLTCQLNSIDLQATGGVDYSWSDGSVVLSTTADLTVDAPGDFTVTVTGANGCTSEATVEIDSDGNLPTVLINASALNLDCVLDEITLIANASGAVTWSNGLGTSTSIIVTEPGTYTVTTVDANGCEAQASVVITQDVTPVLAGIINNTGTTQLANGVTSINVTATGGGVYSWDNGLGNNATVDLTSEGIYTVTVTGDNGCVDTESIAISNCTPPVITIANLDGTATLTCAQLSIDVQASGADSYAWSNGLGNLDVASIVAPGLYTVTGTTADGCSADATINIDQNIVVPVAGIVPPVATVLTCSVNTIALTAFGGGTYSWDSGLGNAANAVVGSAGIYIVTVTADNGCADTESITITDDGSLPSASIVNNTGTTVLNCSTTSISVTAQGGVSYSWDNGLGNNANATITSAGTYTVTATAANGCVATSSIIVTNDLEAIAGINNTSGTSVLSCALTSINVTATGGVSYAWDGGLGNSADAVITLPGMYTVTVTAANGCSDTESIVVTNDGSAPSIAIANNTGTSVLDCVVDEISLTATGGTSYTWNNGLGSSANVIITEPGTYTVTSQEANGCSGSSTVVITEDALNPVASINTPVTTVLTCTVNSIELTATGGGIYSWSNGLGNSANAVVGSAGTYTVTVTGDNGCTNSASIAITDDGSIPTAAIVNNTGTTTLTCTTTSINVTATGGINYSWSGGFGNSANATIAAPGTYVVTVLDANGCSATSSITITQDNTISTSITPDAVSPVIDCNNSDIVLAASGVGSFEWSNGLGTGSSITATEGGNYSVTITGTNGCTDVATFEVLANFNLPNVGITNNSGTTVLDCDNNSISLTATGAVSYEWANNLSSVAVLTVTIATVYTVTGIGANGCVQTASVTITQNTTAPIAGITSSPNGTVLTCSQPSIVLTATGNGTYVWSGGEVSNAITVTAGGTYAVTVTGSNGCTDTESISITENLTGPVAQIINADGSTQLSCSLSAIDVTAVGGGTYSWSGGLGGNAAVSLTQPGTYTVTVTSPNGCTDTESITITDDGSLPEIAIEATTNELNCFTSSIELTATGDAGTLTWSVDGEDCPGVPNTALICSDFYDPICGCDGVTYSNPCYAEREAGVLHYLPGECGSTDGASSISVNSPGTYTVTLDVDGCIATYSFEVEENLEVPSASVTAVSPICSNENATFTISGTAGDVVTYTTTGGASIQTITMDASGSIDVVVNAPSSDVTLELIDVTRGNCFSPLDATVSVVVVSSPVANATGPAFALCEGLTLSLASQEVAGATYSWTGPGGFTSANSDVLILDVTEADAGQYYYSVSVGDCVDYDTVNVAVALPTAAIQNVTLCIGQLFTLPSGVTVNAEGTYTSNLFNSFGCDSTVTTNITVVDEFLVELEAAICEGDSYELPDGTSQTAAGTYTFEFVSSGGCDSIVTVVLEVNPSYYTLQTVSICEGDSYTLADGTSVDTSDLYVVEFTTDAGCDSIVAVQLNVLPLPEPVSVNYDLCFGETVTLQDGAIVSDAGSYPVVLQTTSGCDSLIINNVNVWPNYNDTIQVVICHDEQYELPNGVVVSDDGDYVQFEGQSANGCDSTFVITVIELDPIVQEVVENLCYNGAYLLPDGTSVGENGLYEFVLTSSTGCDSLVSIQLEVSEQIFGEPEQVLLCFGETHILPNGDEVTANGEYTSVLSTDAGCDSLIVSSVVTLDYIFTEVSAFACQGETYTLPNGQSAIGNGVYPSILTNEVGCDSTVQVTLTFTPQVMVSIIPEVDSLTVCSGDTLLLIADGASFFDWDSANPLSSAEGAVIEAYPTADGFITVSGSNEGCSATDSIYVSVNALPEMQIVAPDAICMGDSVVITAGGADSIVWMNNDYLPCLTCADNTVSPSESTVFMVGGYNGECFGTTSFAMEVQALPVASVFGDTLVCAFSTAELYAAGGESYVWSTGETTSSISVEPGATTIYQVIALSGICADTTVVTVEAIPLPDVTTNNDTTITLGGDVQLFATGGVSYSWSPATDLSCSTCFNPIAIPSETTVYCVEAISDRGCADIACVRIEVTDECETFFIPNAFAPERGGHELNDCFRPFGEECFASMRIRVFDRWGELVFESTSFDECWDGNYQGKKVNAGVFVYYFDGLLINGDPFYRKGNVTVIR